MDKALIDLCIKYGQPIVIVFNKPWCNPFLEEYNIDTSALANQKYDIVRSANITKEIAEIQG